MTWAVDNERAEASPAAEHDDLGVGDDSSRSLRALIRRVGDRVS
jgi:hypothetical protein